MKTTFPTQVKDHFLSKENFTLSVDPAYGILKTLPQPSKDTIGSYYESEAYLSHDDSASGIFASIYRMAKSINLKRKASLLERSKPGYISVLDIGCGTGDFLNNLPNDKEKIGVEINPKAANLARSKKLTVHKSLEQFDKKFDVITMWHVLEHLYDPDATFQHLNRLLKLEGTLIIALPNYKSWDAQYYRSDWAGYDVPRHLWHYDKDSFIQLCKAHNMHVVKILPMFMDAYYVSLLSEKYRGNAFPMFRALLTGTISNIRSLISTECSSQIYIVQKNSN